MHKTHMALRPCAKANLLMLEDDRKLSDHDYGARQRPRDVQGIGAGPRYGTPSAPI